MRFLWKTCVVLFGSFITSIGIILFVTTGHGVDPISVLLQGLENYTPFRFGTLSQLFNAIVLFVVFLLDRSKIYWGSLLNALSVGYFINRLIVLPIFSFSGVETYFFSIVGVFLLGMGLGVYLSANFGVGALEGLMIYLSDKWGISIKFVRIGLDAMLVISGFLLGGTVGLGTLVGVLLIGPTIEWTLTLINVFKGKIKFS
ncbi:YczE/YyaS/YitT family protein [Bacillus massiliigorillae]|uniref:YczE/YyaS/YitT family protein n=1 Tax=Bacillus massiliigorillae TaxID=1243664 RepID=UPI00039A2959|nr:YitT family protein [Bacillus massiliigorillae]